MSSEPSPQPTTPDRGESRACATVDEIKTVVSGVRSLHTNSTLIGKCREVSVQSVDALETRLGISPTVREFQLGEARVTHFALTLPADQIQCKDPDRHTDGDSRVIIDPTIKQFSLANWHSGCVEVGLSPESELPTVGVYFPGDEERTHWYYLPNEPRECVDVFDSTTNCDVDTDNHSYRVYDD